jgi:hypothetical protein
MTRGEVLAHMDPSDLMVVKKESESHSDSGTQRNSSAVARGVFPCDRCGRSYARKDSLQRHLQWECGKEPTFQCPFCAQHFVHKSCQIHHIHRQHSDVINMVDPKSHSRIVETVND